MGKIDRLFFCALALIFGVSVSACGDDSKCTGAKCGGEPASTGGTSAPASTGGKGDSSASAGSGSGSGGQTSSSGGSGGGGKGSAGMASATGGKGSATGGAGGSATSGIGGGGQSTAGSTAGASGSSASGSFAIMSMAFADGTKIATKYRCMGPSPDLKWSGEPSGTKSFAIVFKDLTPGISLNYLHWVIYDIDLGTKMLTENVPIGYEPATPDGAHQAPIWNNTLGFNGPCAPTGTNMYELTLYALDVDTLPGLSMSSKGADVVSAIDMHKLGTTKLMITSSAN